MDNIKQYILSVCLTTAVFGIVMYIIPENNIRKTVRTVSGIVLLSVIILPFNRGISLPSVEQSDFSYSAEDIDDITTAMYEKVAQNSIENNISGICSGEFNIEVTAEHNGTDIILTNVVIGITQNDTENSELIQEKVSQMTGLIPELIIMDPG